MSRIALTLIMGEAHVEGESHGHPEIPNFITLLHKSPVKDTPAVHFLAKWENPVFSLIVVFVLLLVFKKAMSKSTLIPGKLQNFVEMLVDGISGFFEGIIGEKYGKKVCILLHRSFYIYLVQ